MVLALVLGILVGLLLGLTGAGGGILAVPALVGALGWSMQQAAPVALIGVAFAAASGAVHGVRQGLVRYRAASLMAVAGLPATVAGTWLAPRLPQAWLLLLFAALLIVVALRQWRAQQAPASAPHAHRSGCIHPVSGRFVWTPATAGLLASMGAITGAVTGLLGVGGGFILIPLLRRWTDLSAASAAATALLFIALSSLGAIAAAVAGGQRPPLLFTGLFAMALAIGMIGGRQLAARLPGLLIQRLFALLLVLVAFSLVERGLRVL